MDNQLRVVTHLPLKELWRDGWTTTARGRLLTQGQIVDLLRTGPVQFVVAEVAAPLQWIELRDCHRFWKDEGKPHLAVPDSRVVLDNFPGMYCYFASQWSDGAGSKSMVVLEKHH